MSRGLGTARRASRGTLARGAGALATVVSLVAAAGSFAAGSFAAGCQVLVGGIKPVPAVHRIPIDVEGRVILVAEDPIIETKDPVHIARAKEALIPQGFRASMTAAFGLAGFKVVSQPSERHDLVAKLALAVREEQGRVYQTYRVGLRGADGTEVAQIDWAWPQGTFVDPDEVFDYATHNVATEIAMSRTVIGYLRGQQVGKARPAVDGGAAR